MREENKRTFYFAHIAKVTDAYNMTSVLGYSDLEEYSAVFNGNALSTDNEKFGDYNSQRATIAVDTNDADAPGIEVDDGIWLEEPTIGSDDYYHDPKYRVESVTNFGRKYVYVLRHITEGDS